MKEASLYFPKSVVRGIYAPMKILIHKFIIEKQTIQFLGCPQRHDFCPDCALCKIKPLHALLARNIVLALTDKLQSANRRTWLFLCVISECLCLGEIICQIRSVRFKDVDDISNTLDVPDYEEVGIEALDNSVFIPL